MQKKYPGDNSQVTFSHGVGSASSSVPASPPISKEKNTLSNNHWKRLKMSLFIFSPLHFLIYERSKMRDQRTLGTWLLIRDLFEEKEELVSPW